MKRDFCNLILILWRAFCSLFPIWEDFIINYINYRKKKDFLSNMKYMINLDDFLSFFLELNKASTPLVSLWWRRKRLASWKGHPLDLLWWKNPRRFRTNIFVGTRNCVSVTDDFQRRCWWFHESVWMRGSEAICLSLGKERNEKNNKNDKAHWSLNFSWKSVF